MRRSRLARIQRILIALGMAALTAGISATRRSRGSDWWPFSVGRDRSRPSSRAPESLRPLARDAVSWLFCRPIPSAVMKCRTRGASWRRLLGWAPGGDSCRAVSPAGGCCRRSGARNGGSHAADHLERRRPARKRWSRLAANGARDGAEPGETHGGAASRPRPVASIARSDGQGAGDPFHPLG